MNRSGRGFGLTGVAVAVAVMIVMAVFSTSAQSSEHQVKTSDTNSISLVTIR